MTSKSSKTSLPNSLSITNHSWKEQCDEMTMWRTMRWNDYGIFLIASSHASLSNCRLTLGIETWEFSILQWSLRKHWRVLSPWQWQWHGDITLWAQIMGVFFSKCNFHTWTERTSLWQSWCGSNCVKISPYENNFWKYALLTCFP